MDETAEFRWDVGRLNWFMGLLTLIGAPGMFSFLSEDWSLRIFGLCWTAVFGIGCVLLAVRKGRREPVVTVSSEGIFDTRVSGAILPWSAITGIEEFEAENVPFVGLEFNDARAALSGAKPVVRFFAPLHRLLRFPDVSINMSLLDGSDADLMAAIHRFRPGTGKPV